MARTRDWKPCGQLTPADFERHAFWGFDLDRGESRCEADETWVRPYELTRVPKDSDTLFARATALTRTGRELVAMIGFRFRDRAIEFDRGVLLLEPSYLPIMTDEADRITEWDIPLVRRAFRRAASVFPMTYHVAFTIGRRDFEATGTIRLAD